MTAKSKPVTKIEVVEEPEIQYSATPELFAEIREWLMVRGGVAKKSAQDHAVYYDTPNMRLLREGIEYRIKQRGSQYRHDMKTPQDTNCREVVPDENDILWRQELKFKSNATRPTLGMFFGQALLRPVQRRVYRFLDKELEAKFASDFLKEKIDHETDCKRSRVEYSFQTGNMVTPDGTKRSELYHILELELREGAVPERQPVHPEQEGCEVRESAEGARFEVHPGLERVEWGEADDPVLRILELAGEPVAVMGKAAPQTSGGAQSRSPALYIEFRKDARPVDPDPWWSQGVKEG